MVLQVPDRQKLSGIVFSEPLSESTEKKRRSLLFAATFSILLTVYGLKVTKTPWLDIDIPAGAPNILEGAMSVALVYTFSVFALYALADLRRWFAAGDLMHLHTYFDLMLQTQQHIYGLTQWVERAMPEEKDKRESVERIYREAGEFMGSLKGVVETARRSHGKLTAVQWIRLSVFDLGVPFLLGIFAMFKISSALVPFLSVVFK